MRKRKKSTIFGLITLAVLAGLLSCDRDCPSCPDDEPPEVMDYRLYAYDPMNRFIMSMDIPEDTLIDSMSVDYSGAYIFVTPDGNKLLVMRFNYEDGHEIEVYNTADLSHDQTLDLYGFYYFDGGDNYAVCFAHDSVCFVNPSTFAIVKSILLPYSAGSAYLDTVTDRFFVESLRSSDTASIVHTIDCLTRELTDSVVFQWPFGGIVSLAYNWLTDDLYMHTKVTTGVAYIRIYNLGTDSIISSYRLTEVGGAVAVSPDGNEVYVTDGGNGMLGYIPEHPLWIFDALSRLPKTWIPPYDSAGFLYPYFGQVCFTPDGNRAYVGMNASANGPVPIISVDTREREIIRRISPFPAFTAIIASGPVPQIEIDESNK